SLRRDDHGRAHPRPPGAEGGREARRFRDVLARRPNSVRARAMARPGKHQETAPQPRLRRAYYDCRYGQLHLHNAIPPGGGFDELTSVICLHDEGETGGVFLPAMQSLGARRSVYAPDLPGTGGTDPAPGVPPVEAAVNMVCDFL